jgi:Acetyltransferase (GNAT) domain
MTILRENNFHIIEEFLLINFSSPTHWPYWNKIVSKYYLTDFYYLTAYHNNTLVGICPVHKKEKGFIKNLYSGQFHYIPYGGWLFNRKFDFDIKNLPLKFNESFRSFCLPKLEEFNVNYTFPKQNNFETLVIYLLKDEDEIWNNDINSKRRNMLRKAEKNGIEVVELPKDNLADFYEIYNAANIRYKLDPLPIIFFEDLFSNDENTKFNILLSKKDGIVLSGIVLAYDKNYAIYWLGFNSDNAPNLGQNELLQWYAIKKMMDYGCKYYDLCYIEKERLPYIYEFKKGFSKNEVDVPYFSNRSLSYKILNRLL